MSKKMEKNKAQEKDNEKEVKLEKSKSAVKKSSTKKGIVFSRLYFFVILDLITFLMLFYFLGVIKKKAVILNDLVNAYQNAQQSSKVNFVDLEIKSYKEKADKIISLFPNDQRLLDFIKIIEDKSGDNGSVVNFTFATKEPVRDSTTRLGVPVVINFKGSWMQIDKDLRDIQSAPFLFRPITIEAKNTNNGDMVELMYGGFLYVDESF